MFGKKYLKIAQKYRNKGEKCLGKVILDGLFTVFCKKNDTSRNFVAFKTSKQ